MSFLLEQQTQRPLFCGLAQRLCPVSEISNFNACSSILNIQIMNELEKNVDRKVTRMEHEYQDLVIKTEFLKNSKQRIKKDIEFYKAAISKLAFIYDINVE